MNIVEIPTEKAIKIITEEAKKMLNFRGSSE